MWKEHDVTEVVTKIHEIVSDDRQLKFKMNIANWKKFGYNKSICEILQLKKPRLLYW